MEAHHTFLVLERHSADGALSCVSIPHDWNVFVSWFRQVPRLWRLEPWDLDVRRVVLPWSSGFIRKNLTGSKGIVEN